MSHFLWFTVYILLLFIYIFISPVMVASNRKKYNSISTSSSYVA